MIQTIYTGRAATIRSKLEGKGFLHCSCATDDKKNILFSPFL
jgi:hypothetical protein